MQKLIFNQTYYGFESLADLERDISEALDPTFNPTMEDIPPEFQGKMTVTITYDDGEQENPNEKE